MLNRRFSSSDWPPPPPEQTFVDLLIRRADEAPDREIYHFLDDQFFESGAPPGPSLTYGQVDRQARAIAETLGMHCRPGDRGLLLFAPGLEFMPAFFGCLYAGVIPVPAYPPSRGFEADPLAILRGIATDCQPAVVLTGGPWGPSIRTICESDPCLGSRTWVSTDAVEMGRAADWSRPDLDGDTISLLQYTSGSTGAPRGVVVTARNLMANQYCLQLALNHMTHLRPGSGICWLPLYHDMGLMCSVLLSAFVDGPCYFMSPLQFLRRPVRWLQAITRLRPHTTGGPNFAYELCVEKITEEEKEALDLSSWEIAGIGAEPISPKTIIRFGDAFAGCGFDRRAFYPSYGLAEATLFVAGGDHASAPVIREFSERAGRMVTPAACNSDSTTEPADGERLRSLVGCGQARMDHQVCIVHPQLRQECAAGEVGEIWVSGPSVAQGYWNRPTESEEVFNAVLSDGRGPFLRTGDLGFFHEDELFISGRLKDLIVVRGRNHHPEDIEATVSSLHPAFRPGSTAAISSDRDGDERLVLLQEIDRRKRSINIRQLHGEIRSRIAEEHRLQVAEIVFVRNGALPKTTSGKIRRAACRTLFEQGQLAIWKPAVSSPHSQNSTQDLPPRPERPEAPIGSTEESKDITDG